MPDRIDAAKYAGHIDDLVLGGPYPSVSVCVCVDPGNGGPDAHPPHYEAVAVLWNGPGNCPPALEATAKLWADAPLLLRTALALQAENDKLTAKLRDWNIKVAQDCTPSGSEYHDNPERCAAFFKDLYSRHHKAMKESVTVRRERDALLAELARTEGGGA